MGLVFNDQGGAGRDDGGVGDGDLLACKDVGAGPEAGGDLGVMGPRNRFLLRRVIDIDEDLVCVVIPEIGVGVVPGHEVKGLTVVNHFLTFTPLEESLDIVMKLRLDSGASFRGKQVDRVAFPSAREIHA